MAAEEAPVSKRLLTLVILAGVLAAAVGAYLIIKAIPPKTPEDTGSARVEIDRFDVEKVQKMELESAERTLTLVKQDGSWKLDLPYEVDLDQTKIEDIAYSFSSMYAESLVEEKASDLAAYGLATPAQKATATLTDGTTRTYFLGSKTPTGNTYYLMTPKDSSKVYAVWMNHGSNFSASVTDLRWKKMPTVDKEKMKYVYLKWKGEKALEIDLSGTVERNAYVFGSVVMTKPYRQPRGVDSEKLQTLLDAIYFSEIKGFVEDNVKDLSKYGLDPAEGEVILKDETNTVHILVGKNLDEYTTYFRYPTSRNVYTIEKSRIDALKQKAFPLADKFAFIVNIDWVDRIAMKHADGRAYTVDIKRESKDEEGNWKSSFKVNGKDVDDEKFRKFYQTIIGVLLDGESEREARGTPVATVTFTIAADEAVGRKAQSVKLEYLDYNASFYAVRRDGVVEFVTAKGRDLEKSFADAEALLK
jgi:hypothetical protein